MHQAICAHWFEDLALKGHWTRDEYDLTALTENDIVLVSFVWEAKGCGTGHYFY